MALRATHSHVVARTLSDQVILIRRVRHGRVYYIAPGSEVQDGETPGAAAERVAAHHLGIEAVVERLLFAETFAGVDHFFFLASAPTELLPKTPPPQYLADSDFPGEFEGTYETVRLERDTILAYDVRPVGLARRVAGASSPADTQG